MSLRSQVKKGLQERSDHPHLWLLRALARWMCLVTLTRMVSLGWQEEKPDWDTLKTEWERGKKEKE